MFLEWDGRSLGPWMLALEGSEAVINLTGRSVNCRYNRKNREEILASRIDSTRVIGEAIAKCKLPPKTWLNASSATWYRHAEDAPQNDWLGEPSSGFSYDVVQAWEDTFFAAAVPAQTRKVAMRIGMVLANEPSTVYFTLDRLTRWGLGGVTGSGKQRVSWIHMEDFLKAVDFIIKDPFLDGAINLCAPNFPTNQEWMKVFREVLGMPIGLSAPRPLLEIGTWLLGTESELVTKSRWADPVRLKDAGFRWRWVQPNSAIADLKNKTGLTGFFRQPATRSAGAKAWLPVTTSS